MASNREGFVASGGLRDRGFTDAQTAIIRYCADQIPHRSPFELVDEIVAEGTEQAARHPERLARQAKRKRHGPQHVHLVGAAQPGLLVHGALGSLDPPYDGLGPELDRFAEGESLFVGEVAQHALARFRQGLDREIRTRSRQIQGRPGRPEAKCPGAGQVFAGLQQAAVLGPAVVRQLREELERVVDVDPLDDRNDLAGLGVVYDLSIIIHNLALT